MVLCICGPRFTCAGSNPITQVIHRHLRNGRPSIALATCCQDDGEGLWQCNLTDEMAYRHFKGEVIPERDDPARDGPAMDDPERDDPEKDGPERDDQFSSSEIPYGINYKRSFDDKEFIKPHKMAIPQEKEKIYYIYSNISEQNPHMRYGKGKKMSEKIYADTYIRPHKMAALK